MENSIEYICGQDFARKQILSGNSIPDTWIITHLSTDWVAGYLYMFKKNVLRPKEIKTMISKKDFLERRKSGIGGSDIASIIGLSPWRSPRDVWYTKVGHYGDGSAYEQPEETDAQHWGTILEDVVANEYERITGNKVFRCSFQFNAKETTGVGESYFVANCDRFVAQDTHAKPVVRGKIRTDRILECKTASMYASDEWGESGTDEIPEYYRCQIQWYLGVTGCHVCDVAVLIGGRDFRIYTIERNDEEIAFLFEKGKEFWENFVEKDILPPPSDLDDVVRTFKNATPDKTIYASDDVISRIDEICSLKNQADVIEKKIETIKAEVCEFMGDAVSLVGINGNKLCSWSAPSEKVTVDYKGIVKSLDVSPEVIEKFTSKSTSSRIFRLASKAGKK